MQRNIPLLEALLPAIGDLDCVFRDAQVLSKVLGLDLNKLPTMTSPPCLALKYPCCQSLFKLRVIGNTRALCSKISLTKDAISGRF